nr:ATP-binding protein [uncultured Alistipes sp.]
MEAQAAVETWDGSGKPLVLVGSSQVITERKKMEQELMSAKDRAEESNRLKSAFLANMSHEIRTPLNAIVGFSGILALSDSEQEKQEYVGIIENNNALLLQLIGDILDLSKIEAGTLEFVYSDFDLNELMQEKERVMRMRLKTDRVELAFERPLAECPIRSERNRLSQLLINLISNAIKFTKQGSIRFGYELRGQEIYCYVTDTGCGIPQDKKDSVFGRFVKLNHFEQGTGLGLSICHTIVRHMGGRIGVESEEGKGSTFWFTIPYTPATLRPEDEPEERPLVAVEKDKLTVLIAEDDDSNYRLFETILRHDYRLVHAWNGKEAVELFEQYRPHLVLMDLNMPVMDGYEATREIRKISSDVPVLAVTAFAFASDEQKVMQNGFDGYMPKPINAKQLKGQILDMLQSRMTLI